MRNEQLWRHIFENVRTGRMNEGDVEALLSACLLGRDRLLEVVGKYGVDAVMHRRVGVEGLLGAMLRAEIEKIPDGVYEAPLALFDNDGRTLDKPLPIATKVIVEGSDLIVDLEGTSPEVPTGINVPFQGSTQMAAYFTVRSIFMDEATYDEFIPQNEGMFRPITVLAPEGCLFNPSFPRSCFSRFPQLQRLSDNINLALAPVLGERAMAGQLGALPRLRLHRLRPGDGRVLGLPRGQRGRLRGRYGKDGLDSVDTLIPNTRNNPIEELEWRFPMRCERYELRDEPAAPGKWRGGIGIVRQNRFLVEGFFGCEGTRQLEQDPPRGLFGGVNGRVGSLTRNPGHGRGGDQRDGDRGADPRRRPVPDRGPERRRFRGLARAGSAAGAGGRARRLHEPRAGAEAYGVVLDGGRWTSTSPGRRRFASSEAERRGQPAVR